MESELILFCIFSLLSHDKLVGIGEKGKKCHSCSLSLMSGVDGG